MELTHTFVQGLAFVAILLKVLAASLLVWIYFKNRKSLFVWIFILLIAYPNVESGTDRLCEYYISKINEGKEVQVFPFSLISPVGQNNEETHTVRLSPIWFLLFFKSIRSAMKWLLSILVILLIKIEVDRGRVKVLVDGKQ